MQKDIYEIEFMLEGYPLKVFATEEQRIISGVKPIKLKGNYWLYKNQIFLDNPIKESIETIDLTGLPLAPDQTVKNINRPDTWNEYIGQEHIKIIAKNAIAVSIIEGKPFRHTLIYGSRGLGKTTLANLISKYAEKEIIEVVGGMITDKQDLINLLKQLTPQKNIIFIDEIHSVPAQVGEILYPLLEDGKIGDKKIIPFTLIGCTTEIGEMIKNYAPLIDRFGIQLNLLPYTPQELATITKNLCKKYNLDANDEVYNLIGSIGRGTARLAVNFVIQLRDMAILGDKKEITLEMVNELMKLKQIFTNGITIQDIKVLTALSKTKTLGLNAISQLIRVPEKTYLLWIEPFLTELGYIMRLPRGRSLTDEGREFLKGFNNE